ncbi:hypothetical protein P5P86_08295 [Nocardioides sp. BP30]|uniref:hypothetical protein n=1 Tax=Nocardioides sp. BP30 TaxID=3036374 RepID=UPI0024694CDA|nr:hypothetical protein [Nocardioides sp. BP30]WGL53816.1 hypothetical protein P5P86_08295 [Nocardioides sp. BP30]
MTEDAGDRPGADHQSGHEPLGSAAEEAARLFGALGDWAKQHGGDVANNLAVGLTTGLAGLAGHAQAAASDLGREAARDLGEHLATGAPECTYCPICRTVHVVREASPEVMVHLASAAASLMQAVSAVITAAAESGSTSRRGPSVEKIDLDPEHGWSDDWPDDSSDGQENQE